MMEQFDIWNQLYDELDIGEYITHRAVGGLVKLRDESPHIKITPFVSMLFRMFYDYVRSKNYVNELRIHVLGIAMERYRFAMTVVEKLFNKFGEEFGTKVIFTYDTVQTSNQAHHYKNLKLYTFKRGRVKEHRYDEVNDEILSQIYSGKLGQVKDEIERGKKTGKLDNINTFIPLNLYSTMQVDELFEYVVNKKDNHKKTILDKIEPMIDEELSSNVVLTIINQLIIDYPVIFKKLDRKKIAYDLMLISKLWQWYDFDQDLNHLNEITKDYIDYIDFPTFADLRARPK